MTFESFVEAQSVLLWSTFAIALLLGAVVNKTNFCTMGAVSDWVNIGDLGRFRAWMLAATVALVGVIVLEGMGMVQPDAAFPPYRSPLLIWAENLLGGVMFGIGMTLASGCGNKVLIRIGGGNLKSIVVLLIIAVIAYFMINPFPDSDQTLMSLLFFDWIRPLAVDMGSAQDLGTLASPDNAVMARLVIGGLIAVALLMFIFKSVDFRNSFDNLFAGLLVGLAVLGAWYVSSNVTLDVDG
ncbi:Lipocalin-related protein and Bos/Can/Equ allergen, partial [hydrothermal vent metagenome]